MNTIKHQFLSVHRFAAVVLPEAEFKQLDLSKPITMQQRDGTTVTAHYIDHYRFNIMDLPTMFTTLLFGITTDQMRTLLNSNYKAFARQQAKEQTVYYIAVQKI